MGLLTLSVANGERKEVDQCGALREVLHQPFGTVLVILLAIGFAATRCGVFPRRRSGSRVIAGSTFARVVSGFRGLALCGPRDHCGRRAPWISELAGAKAARVCGRGHEPHRRSLGSSGLSVAVVVGRRHPCIRGRDAKVHAVLPTGSARRKDQVDDPDGRRLGNVARGLVFAGAGALVCSLHGTTNPAKPRASMAW